MTKIVYQDKYDNISQKPHDNSEAPPAGVGQNYEEGWDASMEDGDFAVEEGGLEDLQSRRGRSTPKEEDVEVEMEGWLEEKKNAKAGTKKDVGEEGEVEEESGEFKLKNGVRYYDSKDSDKGKGYDFALEVTGDRVRSVVETEGNIILNLPKDAEALVSQSGNKLTVRVGHEKIEINLDKCSGVHFVGGKVSGDVENEDKKITTDSGNFISDTEIKRVKEIIANAPGKIGTMVYGDPELSGSSGGDGEIASAAGRGGSVYNVGFDRDTTGDPKIAEATADAAKQFFGEMQKAMEETDPKKQKALWQNAVDVIQDFINNDPDGGKANNLGHLIGNVLLSEFGGKEQLIEVFEKGLIPGNVAEMISTALNAKPDENTALNDVTEYQHGGAAQKMTHASLAMIFDRAAKAKSQAESNTGR